MAHSVAAKAAPSQRFGASPSNRSLQRGIEILRAFRPGSEWLGNSELAERTGLSHSTVSRLTQTLVGVGYLEHDPDLRMYRLGPPVLSLAHAMRTGSSVLQIAQPMMRALAAQLRINIGLATPDGDEMVYLESIRYNRKLSLRKVAPGQRVPMELTSLGMAYLAVAPALEREALLRSLKAKRHDDWESIHRSISEATASVQSKRYCVASWQPEVVALATPVVIEGRRIYCLNFSMSTRDAAASVASSFKDPLLELADKLRHAITGSLRKDP